MRPRLSSFVNGQISLRSRDAATDAVAMADESGIKDFLDERTGGDAAVAHVAAVAQMERVIKVRLVEHLSSMDALDDVDAVEPRPGRAFRFANHLGRASVSQLFRGRAVIEVSGKCLRDH
jgi:uncharacterized protein YgbK (DUF1537 family)